jgi:hypothetical protein
MAALIPAAMDNRALVKEKSTLLKTTDEETFEVALQGQRISAIPLEQLKQGMRAVYFMTGLRPENYPNGEDKDFLHAFIVENYGGHTVAEIRLAFKMAITGKLDLPLKDVKHYENFSPMYFSTIMEAYRRWARQAKEVVDAMAPPKMREYTEEEKKLIHLDYVMYKAWDQNYNQFRNVKPPLKQWPRL